MLAAAWGAASANVQSEAGNAHWGNEGNARSSWGDAGDADDAGDAVRFRRTVQ